jgi:hypothetical protein
MLRIFAFVLLLLNVGYFTWSKELVRGFGPDQQSEFHRLKQQIRPQDLRVLGLDEAKRLEALVLAQGQAAPARGGQCMMIGLFDSREAAAVREALTNTLPPESWEMEASSQAPRWIVYMGRYDSQETLARKKSELRGMNVASETPRNSMLDLGLSLGGYATQQAAETALAELALRGVRTARVLMEQPEVRGQMLRLPQADDRLRVQIDGLKAEGLRTALAGKAWKPCPAPGQALSGTQTVQ